MIFKNDPSTTNGPPLTVVRCADCEFAAALGSPEWKAHSHELSPRDQRRLRQSRQQLAAAEAAARAPRPCEACDGMLVPGELHQCVPRDHPFQRDADRAQAEAIVALLRRHGYVITKA
jgi:hypothetical protein